MNQKKALTRSEPVPCRFQFESIANWTATWHAESYANFIGIFTPEGIWSVPWHEMTRSISTLPWMGCQSIARVPPSISSGFTDSLPVLIYSPGWREVPWKPSVFAQEHIQISWPCLPLIINSPISLFSTAWLKKCWWESHTIAVQWRVLWRILGSKGDIRLYFPLLYPW